MLQSIETGWHIWNQKYSVKRALSVGALFASLFILPCIFAQAIAENKDKSSPGASVEYVSQFANTNHPEICYWFITPDLLENDKYLDVVDMIADRGLYTMVFLTARGQLDFHNTEKMHPVFAKLVARAHKRGLKVGLQIWDNRSKPIAIDDTERLIVEGEVTLNDQGSASYSGIARNVRSMHPVIKSDLLWAYCFEKSGDGFYEPSTLEDITSKCSASSPDKGTVHVDIHAGPSMNGRTVYLMTQHYYNYVSNHSKAAVDRMLNTIQAYHDIPFDGVGLDEYTNLHIIATWELKPGTLFRERYYSPAMAKEFQIATGEPLERALFEMRYAPVGRPEIRMRAINYYMDLMRAGTLKVEDAVYDAAKKTFGPETFAGLHNTHHNQLPFDEFWVTGDKWWSVPREYAQSDEETPFPTQMGMAMTCSKNTIFNMYYSRNLDALVAKALGCLRYGVRTHYHAFNDTHGWGVSLEKPDVFAAVNPVERCARLLNQFNPSLPQIRLLVVFGTEALGNWYPDTASRGTYDINDKLNIEEKAVTLWQAGYLNALVPSDLIESHKLRINDQGKPEINGHTFDAVVYLYPNYAHESVLRFLEKYTAVGGRLMIEGQATHDFQGNQIRVRFATISKKSISKKFDVNDIKLLGIARTLIPDGCLNDDGSYVFTDLPSLVGVKPASFHVLFGREEYSGDYHGLAAIKADADGVLTKFSASGFKELRRNGHLIFSLKQPTDVFISRQDGLYKIMVAGKDAPTLIEVNALPVIPSKTSPKI